VKPSKLAKARAKLKLAKKYIAGPHAVRHISEGLAFLAAALEEMKVELEQFQRGRNRRDGAN